MKFQQFRSEGKNAKQNATRPVLLPSVPATGKEFYKMAYTITEAQAAELLKIADTLVGKQVKNGLIQADLGAPAVKEEHRALGAGQVDIMGGKSPDVGLQNRSPRIKE
jgi:hypothetical protein